ncbi:MAG: DNA alkylation repair protein [Candidatus Aminicenantales bacterium]
MGRVIEREKAISPEKMARNVLSLLKKKADPEKAAQSQRYFKDTVCSYGWTAEEIRSLAHELYLSVKKDWDFENALELCEILLPHAYLEAKGIAVDILLRYKKDFPPKLFNKIKAWLSQNYCDNWATVDSLCPEAAGALLERYPNFLEKIKTWVHSPNRWVQRASAVSFIKLARRGKFLGTVYEISEMLFAVKDDLIEKANGWLLREAGKTDMERLEKFLLVRGPKIPRTTLRYAVERFPEKRRKRLLLKTKPKEENKP